jgi:hypothetical protein
MMKNILWAVVKKDTNEIATLTFGNFTVDFPPMAIFTSRELARASKDDDEKVIKIHWTPVE